MRLSYLINCLGADKAKNPVLSVSVHDDPRISSIHYRAQKVEPNGLFVAIPGTVADGHDYISQAIDRGAIAVLVEKPCHADGSVAVIRVANSRRALAALSAGFYGRPSANLCLIGITGTNGKTTVTYFVEAMLACAGKKTGVVGTVECRWPGNVVESRVTTPESKDLQKILRDMVKAGVTHAIVEVSSHALIQDRVRFCDFDVSVFTNLSQDHLDYHKDMETYFKAKRLLFSDYLANSNKKTRTAVINLDDPNGARLCRDLPVPVLCTGLSHGCTIRACDIHAGADGVSGHMETPAGDILFTSSAVGRHNLYNLMSAAAVGVALGLPISVIEKGLCKKTMAPGRLERIGNDLNRHVFVDYAHTPDALKNVLYSLKNIAKKRIITVFGCGGDRDQDKRAKMGVIAANFSDLIMVTTDNSRSEDPEAIMAQIKEGVAQNGLPQIDIKALWANHWKNGYVLAPDRRQAILEAVLASGPGDIVLIAGKGHETYQIMGDTKIFFDDRVEARNALDCLALKLREDK